MDDVGQVCSAIRGKLRPGPLEVAELAARQGGVVARWQLAELGFGRHAIDRMAANGYLHPLYRGVYAVGHPRLDTWGRVMAGVLAHGTDAMASHVTGGWCWEMLRWPGNPLDITVLGRAGASREGIRVHRPRHLHPDDHAVVDG